MCSVILVQTFGAVCVMSTHQAQCSAGIAQQRKDVILGALDAVALRQLPRDEVESGLDFVGFAVFQVGV